MSAPDAATPSGFSIGDASHVLDAMIRYSGDCVHVVDLDGRVLRWNAACEEVYGWSAREVIGEILPLVAAPRRRRVIHDIRVLAGSDTVTERVGTAERPDGSKIRIHMSVIPIKDEDGDPSGVAVISREVLADDRLERQRDEFAAYVGDRLAGPLNVIANAAALLAHPDVADDPVRRQKLAVAMQANARRAGEFVDDLLTTTLASRAELVLDREPVDAGEVVAGIVSDLGESARRVIMEFDQLTRPVLADRQRLGRAVRALLAEALEAGGDDGRVHVSVTMKGDAVQVRLRSDARLAPMSGSVETLRSGTPDAQLSSQLARGIVEAHGGTMIVSADGDGHPAVTVTLPAERAAVASGGLLW